MGLYRAVVVLSLFSVAFAQTPSDPKQRAKAVRELAKQGAGAIPKIEPYLSDSDLDVRIEAVKAIVDLGTNRSLDPLIRATRDNDPEMQIRATDGLVNFYLPGYVKTGLSGSLHRVGTVLKGKFTDVNDQVIDPYIQVRPEVIQALGRLARGGSSMDARANAGRGIGILRGRGAIDDLIAALRSKDDQVIYESLVALQKIRDPSAAPRITFLLHDLKEKVQITAIETVGLLGDHSIIPDLVDVLNHTHSVKVRRAALESLAMLPDEKNRAIFTRYFNDKDDQLRAAAAEGFARLKNPADRPMLEKAFSAEKKMNPRLSLAFALVAVGDRDMSEFSPLRYLINTLNSSSYQGVAEPFLIELARDKAVRDAIYPALTGATKDEKMRLGWVLARSGDRDSVSYLETLSNDSDPDVAKEGLRALRTLRARLPG